MLPVVGSLVVKLLFVKAEYVFLSIEVPRLNFFKAEHVFVVFFCVKVVLLWAHDIRETETWIFCVKILMVKKGTVYHFNSIKISQNL